MSTFSFPLRTGSSFVIGCGIFFLACAMVEAQITNGSFESGFTGWTTSGTVGIGSGQGKTDGANATNWNGGNLVGSGVISQAFATTSGTRYMLQFDYGVFGTTQTQTMNASVTGSGSLLNQTVSATSPGGTNDTTFTRYYVPFIANSATSTLTFSDLATAGQSASADGNLDRVVVTAVPVTTISPGGNGSLGTVNYLSGNIALASALNGPTATQSSTTNGGVASRAIDGNTNGSFSGANSTTHTATAVGENWQVAFGNQPGQPNAGNQEYAIDHITIFNRSDCCQDRLVEFNVNVLNASTGVSVLNPFDLGTPNGGNANNDGVADNGANAAQSYPQYGLRVDVAANTIADAVRVVQNAAAPLSLAEVQVQGQAALALLPGDILAIDVAAPGASDFINVTQTANLSGGFLNVNTLAGFTPGGTWNILTATTINTASFTVNTPGFGVQVISGGNGQILQLGAGELEVTTSSNPAATNPPSDTTLSFGVLGRTRVGTSSTGSLSATNSGSIGSINATFGATSGGDNLLFTGSGGPTLLAPGANTSQNYTFTPTTRGTFSTVATVSSEMGDVDVTLSGQAVGPVFQANLDPTGANTLVSSGDTIVVGYVDSVTGPLTVDQSLRLSNVTTDANLDNLEDLTIHTATITGLDADQFSLFESDGVTPYSGGTVLDAGEFIDLIVRFTADVDENGARSAQLTFTTDQGAAVGGDGADFVFNLSATQTPEPAALAMWSLLGLGLIMIARRRFTSAG